ncbi:unnamed protein product [Cylicocyclus nassatus]|uniref:Uncharacterized protein n=1 Tax=Cylicocyclus nassatus TaxID=53992 RepID=A0AA36GSK2_CYLNA|nr:unnamed protein product [Cylicocyclus nassatus]
MDKKQEESVPEESAPKSSAENSEMGSSIPSVVPDLREGLESAHLREPPARGSSDIVSSMENPLVGTAESLQKCGTSSMERSLAGTAESAQKSGTSKESVTSKPEKSGLSMESTSVAGTKSEVSEPAKGTEPSKSPGFSEVSVEIPTEEKGIEKSEEAEKEEEVDFEKERKSTQKFMVFKILQIVLAATMTLQVLTISGYFVFVLFFYVVIAVEETPEMTISHISSRKSVENNFMRV